MGRPVLTSLAAVRLDPHPAPAVAPTLAAAADNVSARFVSYLPPAPRPGARALDLGCGTGVDRPLLTAAGYEWHGIDLLEDAAPILADGQALPFRDATFDLVFSVAVFECFAYPHLAMAEAARVLRPGGRLMVSVAFLTPYIPPTQFHWTHVGAMNAVSAAGLELEVLMADRNWSVLEAAATLGLFPRMPGPAAATLVRPLKWLHRLWWALGASRAGRPVSDVERVLRIAGDIEFVAVKP